MNTKIRFVVSTILLSMLVVVFAFPAAVQAAATQDAQAEPAAVALDEAQPEQEGAFLEHLLLREQLALDNQQNRLTLSRSVADTTQVYIDNQKEKGKDTAALESALDAFNQAIDEAEVDHAAAASVLASPAGFDDARQMVDRAAALDTLRSAGQSLRQAHWKITSATIDLRMAINAYRNQ